MLLVIFLNGNMNILFVFLNSILICVFVYCLSGCMVIQILSGYRLYSCVSHCIGPLLGIGLGGCGVRLSNDSGKTLYPSELDKPLDLNLNVCVSPTVECWGYNSPRAEMSCGHAVTPQSLTDWCFKQLDDVISS